MMQTLVLVNSADYGAGSRGRVSRVFDRRWRIPGRHPRARPRGLRARGRVRLRARLAAVSRAGGGQRDARPACPEVDRRLPGPPGPSYATRSASPRQPTDFRTEWGRSRVRCITPSTSIDPPRSAGCAVSRIRSARSVRRRSARSSTHDLPSPSSLLRPEDRERTLVADFEPDAVSEAVVDKAFVIIEGYFADVPTTTRCARCSSTSG